MTRGTTIVTGALLAGFIFWISTLVSADDVKLQKVSEADKIPEGIAASDWTSIRAAYEAGRHVFQRGEDGAFVAQNPGQGWQMEFDGHGFTVMPGGGGWTWGLELTKYGFTGHEREVEGKAESSPSSQRLEYRRDQSLTEWFVNDQRGMEQGWTFQKRPATEGKSPLRLELKIRGELKAEVTDGGQALRFVSEGGGTVLTYSGLRAWDADQRPLPVEFISHRDDANIHIEVDEQNARYPITIDPIAQQAYLKASNTGADDRFGYSVAVSGDTVVIGAIGEDSNATGFNAPVSGGSGTQADNSASDSGAAYVFVRSGTTWTQQAYLKASNTGTNDSFGSSVAVSGDTVVIGAYTESSNATGVNAPVSGGSGTQADNSATWSGAAYVFTRSGMVWTQQAYLKASNTGANDRFGWRVAAAGDTVVVGAYGESSNATGVDTSVNGSTGPQADNSAIASGAAYVFTRSGTAWTQQAYLKASNTGQGDNFGSSVAASGDTAVVGAYYESSNATGVNALVSGGSGTQADNSANASGAAYVFTRNGTTWTQQAYLKGSNAGQGDFFGSSLAVSGDTVVIGAFGEDSNATGVSSSANGSSGPQADNSASGAGAAYVFTRSGTTWTQQAYLKASNTGTSDSFGGSVAISGDTLVVGAYFESSNATGINAPLTGGSGTQADNSNFLSGAAYVFIRSGTTWTQQAYLKASNPEGDDEFGVSVAVAGDTVIVGALEEDSNATGFNAALTGGSGTQADNSAGNSGAVYVFTGLGPIVPIMAVKGNGSLIASGDSTPSTSDFTDFGYSSLSIPITKSFTITNTGTSPLNLTGSPKVAISGSSNFTISAQPVSPVAATSGTTTFTITFTPSGSASGTRTATVSIANNDATKNPYTFAIQGSVGTPPLASGSVVAWGNNAAGQTTRTATTSSPYAAIANPVVGVSGVTALAAGASHSVALKSDGTVELWGDDSFGQRSTMPAGLSGVKAIAAGKYHTVALKQDGTLVAWGDNSKGQTTGTKTTSSPYAKTANPVFTTDTPPVLLSGVIAIAAGDYHTVALKNDGSVVAWGDNAYGQTTVPYGAESRVTAIAAGGTHTMALKKDGTVVAWGNNRSGQVTGIASYGEAIADPVKLNGSVLSGVIAIAAGEEHSVALLSNGTVKAWGDNRAMQSIVPVEAQSGVTAIAAGSHHTVAMKSDGTVVVWGWNTSGQVSGAPTNGYTTATPLKLEGVILKGVTAIAAGGDHTLAVVGDTTPVLTMHRAEPTSALANGGDKMPIDSALIPTSDPPALKASCASSISGLVCDGVTPLLFKLKHRSSTSASYTLTASVLGGGSVTGGLPVLNVLSNGHWAKLGGLGPSGLVVPAPATGQTTGESYGYLSAIPAESLVLDAGSKEVVCQLSAQGPVGPPIRTTFYLRKPPIALVHGYNTTGEWGAGFKNQLLPGGATDPFIVQIQYGVTGGPDATQNNTTLALSALAPELSRQLQDRLDASSAPLRSNWTYTLYDIVGHSQGGVLARMLCSAQPNAGVPAFRDKSNSHRGRFRRVITIGSPHNGSRLMHYLLESASKNAIIPSILKYIRVLQEKFDPWGAQIKELNKPKIEGGLWVPDSDAKFFMIRTTIDNGAAPSLLSPVLAYQLMGLTLPTGTGTDVLPSGSDGAVDLDSQGYAGGGNNVYTIPGNISHSSSPRLFGTSENDVDSTSVGALVRDSLNGHPPVNPLNLQPTQFAQFVMPTRLSDEERGKIDRAAALQAKIGNAISRIALPLPAPTPNAMAAAPPPGSPTSYGFLLNPPADQSPVGDVEWNVEVFGLNGVTQDGVTLTVNASDSRQVTVVMDASVLGDVMLYARYPTAAGIAYADPIKVVTATPVGATLASLSLLPATASVPVDTSLPLELWATYSDATKLRVYLGGDEVTLTSLNTDVADVAANGTVTLKTKGLARIQAVYAGLTALNQINVSSGTRPLVAPVPNLTATQGKAFQYQFKASDEPTLFGATGLPSGLAINDAGLLSGTPTVSGVFTLGVSAGNAAGMGASREVQLTVAAGVSGAEIVVEQPAGTNIADGGSRNFGAVLMTATASLTFTIKNKGTAPLAGLDTTIEGTNPDDFTLATIPTAPVSGPSGSTTFTVRFSPTAVGKRVAMIRIVNNDSDENPFHINLVGIGNDTKVVEWGTGVLPSMPANLHGVVAIAAGSGHTVALKADGSVVEWVTNAYYQPTLPPGLSGVKAIAAGESHTVVLKTDGTVIAGGWDADGRTMVPVGLSGVSAIASGFSHSFAIKSNGTLVAWGFNGYGQATVPAGLKVKGVAAGFGHTVAVKTDGTVIAWGYDELGSIAVPAGLKNVTAVAAGNFNSLALKSDGTVVAWGLDDRGQSTIPSGLTGVKAMAANDDATIVLKNDGTILAWGSYASSIVPLEAQSGGIAIAAAESHVVALVDASPATAPKIGLEFGGASLTSSPALVTSANVLFGQTGNLTFTIRNSGTASLTDLTVAVDGLNQAEFTVTEAPAASVVAPGASTTFTVQFTPTARGTRTATLHITSNDIYNSPFDVVLNGTCVTPEIVVEQPAGTGLLDGAGSVNFGTLKGGSSASLSFTLKNKGTSTLNGLALSKDGAQANDFAYSSLAVTTLAPNASTTFNVTFSPRATGVRTAALHIVSNDLDESSFDISLTGTGAGTPGISPQPAAFQLLAVGEIATFTSGATGGGTSLQWLKDGKAIPLATGASYSTTASLTNAGNYSLKATNIVGSASSTVAKLGVVSQADSQVLVNEGATLTLVAPAAPPAGTTFTYQWQQNGNDLSDGVLSQGQVVSGAKSAILKITKAASDNEGGYTCEIGMGGPTKTTGMFTVNLRHAPIVADLGPLAWIVSGTVTDRVQAQNFPTTFTFKNLPAGVIGNTATGQLSGKPTTATTSTQSFTVIASNPAGGSVPKTISYTIEALPTYSVGTFNALLDRDTTVSAPVATPAGQKLQGHGGRLTNLVITSTGTFTGTLNLEDKSYPMPSGIKVDAVVGGNFTSATVPIIRGTKTDAIPDLTLFFEINNTSGQLDGTVTDGLPSSTPIPVHGWRNSWTTTGVSPNPATALAGYYTAALEPDVSLQGFVAHPDIPQGNGYFTLTITTAGVVTWGGKLADGTAVTGGTTLGPNGEMPMHMMLYTPTVATTAGSAHGWVVAGAGVNSSNLSDNTLDHDLGGDFLPMFDWMKRAQSAASTSRSYKAGIPLHKLQIIGGGYDPVANTPVLGLTKAKLVFSEGDIIHSSLAGPGSPNGSLTGTLNQAFGISATNVVAMPTGAFDNPGTVTLKLDGKTGSISGNFTLKDNDPTDLVAPILVVTRSVPWSGVIVPRLSKGVGQFQLPQLPAYGPPKTTSTTSPQLSGQTVLEADP